MDLTQPDALLTLPSTLKGTVDLVTNQRFLAPNDSGANSPTLIRLLSASHISADAVHQRILANLVSVLSEGGIYVAENQVFVRSGAVMAEMGDYREWT